MSLQSLSPTSALLAHAERLIAGSRVLVIGSTEHLLAKHLLDRGARLVQVLDPDPQQVAHAAAHNTERRISYAQLAESALRDSAFDVAIVEELGAAQDAERMLAAVRKALGPRGVAFVCAKNGEGTSGLLGTRKGRIDFERLDELASDAFEDVLLLGQAPFVGYSVVSLSLEGPPEPALDNDFLGGEADDADVYIAVCGSSEAIARLDFEDMTIVQFPATQALSTGEASHRDRAERSRARIQELEEALAAARARVGKGDVEELTKRLEARDAKIRELEARAQSASVRLDTAEADRERFENDLRTLAGTHEAELGRLRERLDEAERVATRSQKEARWADERVKKLERELETALASAESEATRLEAELASQEAELEETHRDLLTATEKLAHLRTEFTEAQTRVAIPVPAAEPDPELDRLERQLAERGSRVLELEEQVRKLDLLARSLGAELEDARRGGDLGEPSQSELPPSELAHTELAQTELAQTELAQTELAERLGTLAESLARREADLVAAEWTIGELRQRLASRPS